MERLRSLTTVRLALVLVLTCAIAAALGVFLGVGDDHGPAPAAAGAPVAALHPEVWNRTVVSEGDLPPRMGLKIVRVSASGGGGLVDVRFQVVNPDLAASLHEHDLPPGVIDGSTGVLIDELLMAHSHTGDFVPGVTYFYLFDNPGNFVRPGSTVTVFLGKAEVPDVPVV